jgi:hypothetical protein
VTAAEPGLSGINLSRPSDSGINLQSASGLNLGADSIELAPLSGDQIKAAPKGKPAGGKNKSGVKAKPILSETPPPSREKGDKDIFDDSGFEVNALATDGDSDDKTVQIETGSSDFELEESDTGSEVFAIDEEDVDANSATRIGQVALDEDESGSGEFAADAASGEVSSSAWDMETEGSTAGARAAPATMLAAAGATAEWGGLWVGLLGAATVFMILLGFVSMDLVRNLYDFRSDTPASGIVKGLAGIVGKN